jgi:hypothetical protein
LKKTRRTTGKDTVTQNYNDTSRTYSEMNGGRRFYIQLPLRFRKLISVDPQRWDVLQGLGYILIASRGCFGYPWDFSLLQNTKTAPLGGPLILLLSWFRRSLPWVKRVVNPTPLSNDEITNEWVCAFTPTVHLRRMDRQNSPVPDITLNQFLLNRFCVW